jgi:hypothetical protein
MTNRCLTDCLQLLEARFQMIGRYWSPAVAKVYAQVLSPHEDRAALRAVQQALSERNEPPTDRDLQQALAGPSVRATDSTPEFAQAEPPEMCEETRALISEIGRDLKLKARLPGMSTNPDEPSRAERLAEAARRLKERQASGVPEAQVPWRKERW